MNKKLANSDLKYKHVVIIVLCTLLILFGVPFLFSKLKYRGTERFIDSEWNYMIEEIEKKYGDGKKFVVIDKEVKSIEKNLGHHDDFYNYEKETIGYRADIIGYFENDEKGYFISFSKYIKDSPYKSGNNVIIFTYANDNFDIKEYMKGLNDDR